MTYSSRFIWGVQAIIGVTLTLFNLLQFTSETGSWDIFCFVISLSRWDALIWFTFFQTYLGILKLLIPVEFVLNRADPRDVDWNNQSLNFYKVITKSFVSTTLKIKEFCQKSCLDFYTFQVQKNSCVPWLNNYKHTSFEVLEFIINVQRKLNQLLPVSKL